MNREELKQRRKSLGKTQPEMVEFLGRGTKIGTYQNWEQGISPVPEWVEECLMPAELDVPIVSLDELAKLEAIAKRRADGSTALSIAAEYIREGIKKGLALIAFLLVAWQAFAPADNSLVRKFGGRRRHEYGEVKGLIDADA